MRRYFSIFAAAFFIGGCNSTSPSISTSSGSINLEKSVAEANNRLFESQREGEFARAYPKAVIAIAVAERVKDPGNSTIEGVFVRRNGEGNGRLEFCGTVKHGNQIGYIDSSQDFYGIFVGENSAKVTILGHEALGPCQNRVFKKPT